MKTRLLLLSAFVLCLIPVRAAVVLHLAKTPYESFLCSVDFSQAVGADAVVLDSVNVVDANNVSYTSVIVAPSPIAALVSGTSKVVLMVQGGTASTAYFVNVRVIDTVTGAKYEGTIVLSVHANNQ